MIKDELRDAGLSAAESDVYLCLVYNGPLKASEIANKIGMYRPYVYDNLNKLMEKGLCSQILIDRNRLFKAARPATLREYMIEKVERIDALIPQLEKQMNRQTQDTSVEVYKGKNAIRKALIDILKILKDNKGIVHLGMGIDEDAFVGAEPVFSIWFISQLEKNGIKERLISRESAKMFIGGGTSDYRFIPDEFFNPTQTLIDGSLVTIMLLAGEPKYAIKIRSNRLADAYRKTFELMWNMGSKKNWQKDKRKNESKFKHS